jgi:SAM-dependent methyltransferase
MTGAMKPGSPARLALDDLVLHGESNVLVPPREGTAATYLDGAELYLLETLREASDVSVFSSELRSRVHDWASLYHLTPYRATILDALGLSRRDSRVLELGAGCGAVTRWLGERFEQVDAVEGSLPRALVARERCRDLPGVRVAAANFFDLDFGEAFDLTTLIGVLEYSHLYHPELRGNPAAAALSSLELVRGSLRDEGLLVIAIENRLGLKYWAGCHEDHSSRRYDGIEGYPTRSSAVTFSAAELERLVLQAGFSGVDFYLPFPDYKLARTVLDAAAAGGSTYPANWVETPFPDRAGPQHDAPFDESLALRETISAGLLRELANSFLLLAYNGDRERIRERLGIDEGWIARHYSLDRRPAFCKRTSLERTQTGELVVRNTPAVPNAAPIEPALALQQQLEDEPFRSGHQLLFTLLEHAAAGRLGEQLPALLERLRDFLLAGYGACCADRTGIPLLRGESLDVTWWNVVVDPESGAWHSIDGEWRFRGLLPVDYVLWRGLYHAAARHRRLLASLGGEQPAQVALGAVQRLYPALPAERPALYEELEGFVQRAAGADAAASVTDLPPHVRELVDLASAPRSFSVLVFADELTEHPELLATYVDAFRTGEPATLVAYAPDGQADELAPQLETLLAGHPHSDPDVMLVAVAREAAVERQLAESVRALLTLGAASEPFEQLPRVGAGESHALRGLAFPAETRTAA